MQGANDDARLRDERIVRAAAEQRDGVREQVAPGQQLLAPLVEQDNGGHHNGEAQVRREGLLQAFGDGERQDGFARAGDHLDDAATTGVKPVVHAITLPRVEIEAARENPPGLWFRC